jgi:hypothetical protein
MSLVLGVFEDSLDGDVDEKEGEENGTEGENWD